MERKKGRKEKCMKVRWGGSKAIEKELGGEGEGVIVTEDVPFTEEIGKPLVAR